MGYREWRERQIAKLDAMQARADERVVTAEQRAADVRAEVESARVERARSAVSASLEVEARRLGEAHEDLVARALAVGLPGAPAEPGAVERVQGAAERFRARIPLGWLVVPVGDVSESGGGRVDHYRAWRDQIVVAERMAAKVERGERLTAGDRALMRLARLAR